MAAPQSEVNRRRHRPDRKHQNGRAQNGRAQDKARSKRGTASKHAEKLDRKSLITSKIDHKARRANAEIVGRQTETPQLGMDQLSKTAAKLTARSADHLGRLLINHDDENAVRSYSRNVAAILESHAALAEVGQGLAWEWLDFRRDQWVRNFTGLEQIFRSRTPQDFLASQSELLRTNVQLLLKCARRVAEKAMNATDEVTRKQSSPTG